MSSTNTATAEPVAGIAWHSPAAGRLGTSLGRHWLLVALLAIGLALRLPYLAEGEGYDAQNYSNFAASVLEWGRNFDGYHQSRYSAFPFAHPPLFLILHAPLNWLALRTGGSHVAAANALIYGFELIGAVVLYALALRAAPHGGGRWWRVKWSAALTAGLLYLVPLSPLWLRWRGGQGPDTQYAWIAIAWLLGALYWASAPQVAGTLFGLALATRTEMAFLALPWTLHFARQSLTHAGWFVACSGGVVALVVGPFALRDWQAFDWALRGHLLGRLGQEGALLWRWVWGDPPAALMDALSTHHGVVMLGAVVLASLISWRERLIERRLALVALAQVLTMPVFHNRYGAHAFALSLALAARTGYVWVIAAWCLIALRLDMNVITVGVPVAGLALISVFDRSNAVRAHRVDDALQGWLMARARAAAQLPVWVPAGVVATGVTVVLLGRVHPEPALNAQVGQLQVMGLLGGIPEGGIFPPIALAAWVAGLFGSGGAWRLNVMTALAWGVSVFLLGRLGAMLEVGRRFQALVSGLMAALVGAALVAGLDAVEASPQPFALALAAGLAASIAAGARATVRPRRAAVKWLALTLVVCLPTLRGVVVPVPVGAPDVERRLSAAKALALLSDSLVSSVGSTWWSGAPRSPSAYSDVVASNLRVLEEDAVVCAGAADAWGWQHARTIDRVRPDVMIVAADANTCVEMVIPVFASTRAVYATSLSEEDLKQSDWVFFPARGVWRAMAPRTTIGDGSVLKGPDERIYVVEDGQRRWIPTLESFERAGLSWDRVQLVPAELLAVLPLGPPLGG